MRLAILAGLTCPNCDDNLSFDGNRLRCDNSTDCGYGWRDADTAESDIYFGPHLIQFSPVSDIDHCPLSENVPQSADASGMSRGHAVFFAFLSARSPFF